MKALKEVFESGQTILWIETQNKEPFLRPLPDILFWTPGPTAGLAQPLRFRQVGFAPPELLLGLFARLDVCQQDIPSSDCALRVPKWPPARVKPAEHAVGPAYPNFKVARRPCLERALQLSLNDLQVLRMYDDLPAVEFLGGLARIVEKGLVHDVHFARGRHDTDKTGTDVHYQTSL